MPEHDAHPGSWLVLETDKDGDRVAEYRDFQEEAESETSDEVAHRRMMRRVLERFGYAMPDWVPTIPTRSHRH